MAGTIWRFGVFRRCPRSCIVGLEVNDMYRNREQIAYRIRDCREADGLTREAFEERSGVSSKFLYELEMAQKDMTAVSYTHLSVQKQAADESVGRFGMS